MINGSSFGNKNKKNISGADRDSFFGSGIRKEAAYDTERIREAQREQQKRQIQVQIDNRKRELVQLQSALRLKEVRLSGSKRDQEVLKRDFSLLEQKIKQTEGGLSYLKDKVLGESGRTVASAAKLEDLRTKFRAVENDVNTLALKYSERKVQADDMARRLELLRSELKKLEGEFQMATKEISKIESDLTKKKSDKQKAERDLTSAESESEQIEGGTNKVEKEVVGKQQEGKKLTQELALLKRRVEQAERDNMVLNQEVEKERRELQNHEREIKDLELKRDSVR